MRIARFIILALALCALSLITFSCDEKPTGPAPSVRFEEFVHFDTTLQYFVRMEEDGGFSGRYQGEFVVNWEQSFGEPFTDLDSDGVYTPGTDLFFFSNGPENQDLNRNGRYDGPEPYLWSEGIPFDDIDGDGQFDGFPLVPLKSYESGLPFTDINGNGVYDSILGFWVSSTKLLVLHDSGDVIRLNYRRVWDSDPPYEFISDSGLTYNIWAHHTAFRGFGMLRISPSNIAITFERLLIPILDTGLIETVFGDTAHIYSSISRERIGSCFKRTVLFHQSLTILGRRYTDLLKVSLTDPEICREFANIGSYWGFVFYFDRKLGLIALQRTNSKLETTSFYFDVRYEPGELPLPVTR